MIRLHIKHIDNAEYKELGVYPLFSNQKDIHLTTFQKAYVYGVLRAIKPEPYSFASAKNRNKSLQHICNFLNSSYDGDFMFVDETDERAIPPYDLTIDFKLSYLSAKQIYESIHYKIDNQENANDIILLEKDIIDKYDPRIADDFKCRVSINDSTLPLFKCICRKISDFYLKYYQLGELQFESSLVYLDFIPRCFSKFELYTPINLAFQAKNFDLFRYCVNRGFYKFSLLKEEIPVSDNSGWKRKYLFEHNYGNISCFILDHSIDSLRIYKRMRALHFSEYEELMRLQPNTNTRPGSLLPEGNDVLTHYGQQTLRAEYKASILCNDISNLNYLIKRFREQLLPLLMYRKNIYTLTDDLECIPECILQSTKDFVSCLTTSINSKLREAKEYEKNRPWGYNAVTGAPIYEWQLKDIDSQRW